jgi:sec-independent protein translocase protein TatA
MPSAQHLLILLLVVVLLFGAKRLGDIGKGLGEGIKNFKKGISDDGEGDSKKQKLEQSTRDEKSDE